MARQIALIALVAGAAVGLIGCQSVPAKISAESSTMRNSLMWPSPPAEARIRFVNSVARARDIGISPSLLNRIGGLFLGKDEERFVRPTGVASANSILYVADPGAQAVWIFDPSSHRAQRIREAGKQHLVSPVAVAVGRDGQFYAADSYLKLVLRYDSEGRLIRAITHPDIQRPVGLAYNGAQEHLYVADSATHHVWILDPEGAVVGVIGRRGTGAGEFNFPTHVAVDRGGLVYVTDALGFRVQCFSPQGEFKWQIGHHGDMSGDFAMPKGLAVDSEGHIYVVDALFDAVQIFNQQGRLLLSFGERGTGLGQLWLPGGLFIDDKNQIYVADAYNRRIQIFRYIAKNAKP